MRKFKLEKDYYEDGQNLYKKRTVTIKPGVTVLVGCNGIGKTTMLHQIESHLKEEEVPYIHFDNLRDGGSSARSSSLFYGDTMFAAISMCSSEGENIVLNMEKLAARIGNFVRTGEDNDRNIAMQKAFTNLFKDEEDKSNIEIPKERWILLDAIDSGLSVDNIVDIKEFLFKTILEHNCGNEIYIIVSANEYEMARGENCFDVYNGKYITFKDYEEYRNFILDSKKWKEKRGEVGTNEK